MPKYTKSQQIAYWKRQAKKGRYMKGRGAYHHPGRAQYIRGAGKYSIPRGSFAKIGKAAGSRLAPGIFSDLGGAIGGLMGHGIAKISGVGDYTVSKNTIVYPSRMVPGFGPDSIRVRKREMIAIIDSTSGFTNQTFPINPGLDASFPWLSALASAYEQYHINGMVFQFHSTSSDSIASTTDLGLGTVALVTDYNAGDSAYVNLPQALGSMFANSGKPSQDIMHAIECDPKQVSMKSYFIRSGDVPSGQDIKTYDHGIFELVMDMPATYTSMGQLWVSYDVTLFKSVQNNQLGLNLNTDRYVCTAPAATTAYFGTSRVADTSNNLGTTVSGTVITFPPQLSSGFFLIYWAATGDSTANSIPSVAFANCNATTTWLNDTQDNSGVAATATRVNRTFVVRITATSATVTFSSGTLPANGTFADLIITQVNGNLFD